MKKKHVLREKGTLVCSKCKKEFNRVTIVNIGKQYCKNCYPKIFKDKEFKG